MPPKRKNGQLAHLNSAFVGTFHYFDAVPLTMLALSLHLLLPVSFASRKHLHTPLSGKVWRSFILMSCEIEFLMRRQK